MKHPEIEVDMNSVSIEHQNVKRPPTMSASEWCAFWEAVQHVESDEVTVLRNKLMEANEQINELQKKFCDLEDEIDNLRYEKDHFENQILAGERLDGEI
jgi:hypothetical protein